MTSILYDTILYINYKFSGLFYKIQTPRCVRRSFRGRFQMLRSVHWILRTNRRRISPGRRQCLLPKVPTRRRFGDDICRELDI